MSQLKPTYNYCGICGHVPRSREQEPNWGPLRWWDPDDGYKVGSLCVHCKEDYAHVQPKPGDLAYSRTNGVADQVDTDEDILDILHEET